ncbi:hypothetical protein DdX_16111 [Ditylenchus destructor]|uniref:Uncharacterized protein n=1 Tax=Ditylenchus destructor TaxID=166010 RepID=A0AAD4MU49_9BILA|nr:hypothetical protein DdX_16111 [Ditylenchus destructor]
MNSAVLFRLLFAVCLLGGVVSQDVAESKAGCASRNQSCDDIKIFCCGELKCKSITAGEEALGFTFLNNFPGDNREIQEDEPAIEPTGKDDEEAINADNEEADYIGMISSDPLSGGVGTFRGDSGTSFARWSRRFTDYVEAMGDNWDETKKTNKLKFLLEGLPRRYFDEIPAANRDNLSNVIDLLVSKIDGRKSRESALQELLGIRQKENESGLQFTSRLIPPVEVIMQGKTSEALNERLLDEFLGRIRGLIRVGHSFLETRGRSLSSAQMLRISNQKMSGSLINSVLSLKVFV